MAGPFNDSLQSELSVKSRLGPSDGRSVRGNNGRFRDYVWPDWGRKADPLVVRPEWRVSATAAAPINDAERLELVDNRWNS